MKPDCSHVCVTQCKKNDLISKIKSYSSMKTFWAAQSKCTQYLMRIIIYGEIKKQYCTKSKLFLIIINLSLALQVWPRPSRVGAYCGQKTFISLMNGIRAKVQHLLRNICNFVFTNHGYEATFVTYHKTLGPRVQARTT